MNTQETDEKIPDMDQVKLLVMSDYGLNEADTSKTDIALFHMMMEINARIKRLEDHFLVSIINKDI